jgi:hypothetical protein
MKFEELSAHTKSNNFLEDGNLSPKVREEAQLSTNDEDELSRVRASTFNQR